MEALWGLATVVGPILLIAVIIWAWVSNRKKGQASERRADAASHQLYDRINEEDKRAGND